MLADTNVVITFPIKLHGSKRVQNGLVKLLYSCCLLEKISFAIKVIEPPIQWVPGALSL
jgi:hypothetical protein